MLGALEEMWGNFFFSFFKAEKEWENRNLLLI
jgi:hypothetical protein